MSNGFTKIRSGIKEHVADGRLRGVNYIVYITLILWADYASGLYIGNQRTVASTLGEKYESVRKAFTYLKSKKYINYSQVKGKRGFYKVQVNRYEITSGPHFGKRVNAYPDNGLQSPQYEAFTGDSHETAMSFTGDSHETAKSFTYYKTEDIKQKTQDSISTASLPINNEDKQMEERYEKMKQCIQKWEAISGLKKPHVRKQYWSEGFPPNSWFSELYKLVGDSDGETTWDMICDEYKNSQFLRKGGFKGEVNSIGWVFQDNGKNMAKILSGKYRDKEPDQFFAKHDASLNDEDVSKIKEKAAATGMKFVD